MIFININKIVMIIINHGRVISRFPYSTSEHKCRWRLDVQVSEMKSIAFILQSIIFWDKAHYTQNDNYALKDDAQRKMEIQHKSKR